MATNTQYAELDRLILDRIADYDKPKQYNTIFLDGGVHRELERIADAIGDEPWRILDRRLQAMRRAGKIRYDCKRGAMPPGWVIFGD